MLITLQVLGREIRSSELPAGQTVSVQQPQQVISWAGTHEHSECLAVFNLLIAVFSKCSDPSFLICLCKKLMWCSLPDMAWLRSSQTSAASVTLNCYLCKQKPALFPRRAAAWLSTALHSASVCINHALRLAGVYIQSFWSHVVTRDAVPLPVTGCAACKNYGCLALGICSRNKHPTAGICIQSFWLPEEPSEVFKKYLFLQFQIVRNGLQTKRNRMWPLLTNKWAPSVHRASSAVGLRGTAALSSVVRNTSADSKYPSVLGYVHMVQGRARGELTELNSLPSLMFRSGRLPEQAGFPEVLGRENMLCECSVALSIICWLALVGKTLPVILLTRLGFSA